MGVTDPPKGKVTPLRGRSLPLTTRATNVDPHLVGAAAAGFVRRLEEREHGGVVLGQRRRQLRSERSLIGVLTRANLLFLGEPLARRYLGANVTS